MLVSHKVNCYCHCITPTAHEPISYYPQYAFMLTKDVPSRRKIEKFGAKIQFSTLLLGEDYRSARLLIQGTNYVQSTLRLNEVSVIWHTCPCYLRPQGLL